MAYYAFLDEDNVVVEVISGNDENYLDIDWEIYYSQIKGLICKRTSYNTFGNKHLLGGIPFRKNYAGIGYVYDEILDGFIPPKPFASWILNPETCLWNAPKTKPDGNCVWDEKAQDWVFYEPHS